MRLLRFGRVLVVVLFVWAVLTVGAQGPDKQPIKPSAPAPVQPAELATGPATYIVRLADEPLATYRGDVPGLAGTTPQITPSQKLDIHSQASLAYQSYLDEKQTELISDLAQRIDRQPTVLHRYSIAYNGLAVELTGGEAAVLTTMPGVITVRQDREYQPLTDAGPAWIGAPAIWEGNPAIQNKGEGIIVGVIDTGINIDHPAFADVGGDGYNHDLPPDVSEYIGWCHPAHPNYDPTYICNDKLIGMWDFADGPNESDGPEDSTGHGSHTASTAVGNAITVTLTTATGYAYTAPISGVAPHANLIAYDACIATCPGAALLAAVDQAVTDGVDVINYSISGGANPYNDDVELAFLGANEAGVFVSAAAGNSGPGAETLSHQSPWVATVGAGTHNRLFGNKLTNLTSDGAGSLPDIEGKSVSGGYGPVAIVYAGDYGDEVCRNPFPVGTWVHGEIVVCDRGAVARVTKGANVAAGGAGGLVLVNANADQVVNADAHYLPAVHINYTNGAILKAWLAGGSDHVAAIEGTAVDSSAANGDVMAAFSSRGPNTAFDVIKPDILAPGLDILAALNTTGGLEYGLYSGTSMAAPHHAGAAVLMLGAHPTWSPDQIRSALMMTGVTAVLKEDGVTTADPFDRGAGRVDLAQAVRAGLVLEETRANYEAADPASGGDPRTLNLPSMADSECLFTCAWTRTISSTLTASTNWTVTVDAPLGMTVTVSPTVFSLPSFEEETLEITADVTHFDGSQGWGFASLQLSSPGQATLHMPIAVRKIYGNHLNLLNKTVPAWAEPGQVITYQIGLDNLDAISHTFSLTDTLPPGLEYVDGTATGGLTYNGDAREFTWSGEIGPGTLGYVVNPVTSPNYVNLADIDPNQDSLCDHHELEGDCDDGYIAFDLAASNSASYTFYGEILTQTTAMTNGFLYGPEGWTGSACVPCPQPFPEPAEVNQIIAGLWRDVDMDGGIGDWYAAVVTGLLANPADRVFYINWHGAAQFGAPLTTGSNGIAIVLDGGSEPAGRIYMMYGDFTDTAVLETQGYTIGAENKTGTEGLTYAFRPCPSASCISGTAVGDLPAKGTTLRLDPTIVGGSSAKIFTYQVVVTAAARTLITNKVEATSDGLEPYLVALADLPVEYRTFLPVVHK